MSSGYMQNLILQPIADVASGQKELVDATTSKCQGIDVIKIYLNMSVLMWKNVTALCTIAHQYVKE